MRIEFEINRLKEKIDRLEREIEDLERLIKLVQTERILNEIKGLNKKIIRVEKLINEKDVNILIKLWRKIRCKATV